MKQRMFRNIEDAKKYAFFFPKNFLRTMIGVIRAKLLFLNQSQLEHTLLIFFVPVTIRKMN